ncbi:MAG: YjjG family noncanonical pyrimidine nucleotidase [Pseudomonadota bacterium]|nr:YjjG family noncanonical pyrimidine nucleotidase [Pseudomonadota bacterium]
MNSNISVNLILFDLDDTLIDFESSSVVALESVCKAQGLSNPLEDYFSAYSRINLKLWSQLELGEVTADFVRVERFRRLCQQMKWQADVQKMAESYLTEITSSVKLIPFAKEVCEKLSQTFDLGIITNGLTQVQKARFRKSGLETYFKFLMTSEEQGYHKPDQRIFVDAINKLPKKELAKTLVVGDRIESDILGAKRLGIRSVWLNRHGRPNMTLIKPDFEISCLSELTKLVL